MSLACRKAKDLGYPHELWTTRLLTHHAREHAPVEGHDCLGKLVQGTVCKILGEQEVKPHKVRYYGLHPQSSSPANVYVRMLYGFHT